MKENSLLERLRTLSAVKLRRPGAGATAERHRAIYDAGREDLSLAKLIEAHWDAVAILQEAGRESIDGALYGVWASENPAKPLRLEKGELSGVKDFCSGAGLVDKALVTAGGALVEIDLQSNRGATHFDEGGWRTEAFRTTKTATVTFDHVPVMSVVGEDHWYTRRPGFWQGACGPAAAWAGGAAGLVDYAEQSSRDDAHTLAHTGAMCAGRWAMESLLSSTADRFDVEAAVDAAIPALQLRHTVEQMCTDILRRFGRAFGPAPLVRDTIILRRIAELELYLRQCHAERDLELLGRTIKHR